MKLLALSDARHAYHESTLSLGNLLHKAGHGVVQPHGRSA
jgi:hypothetical protein